MREKILCRTQSASDYNLIHTHVKAIFLYFCIKLRFSLYSRVDEI